MSAKPLQCPTKEISRDLAVGKQQAYAEALRRTEVMYMNVIQELQVAKVKVNLHSNDKP